MPAEPPLDALFRHEREVRTLFGALALVTLLVMGAVFVHEYYVLNSLPVQSVHSLVHVALLAVSVMLLLSVWLLWLPYRRMRSYQASLVDSYANLESLVGERTRELLDSQVLLESLFDAFRERTLVIDADDRIVRANRTAVEGAPGKICGRLFSEVYPGCESQDERRNELRLIRYTFRERKPQRNRLIRAGTDCDRAFSVDTYPVPSADGRVRFVIEVVRDVTDIKYLEIQHQHHDKMAALGLLAAGMAHNLGNPLASLSSELQMLKDEEDVRRIRDSLDVLERHVRRMTASIHEILGFARKRGDRTLSVSLADAVGDTLRLLRHDPRARNVRFESHFEDGLPPIRFNEDDFILVLTNVLVNALDAMPAGGIVRFSARRDGADRVQLCISDNGQGMDEGTLEQATRPLFTTRKEGGGTGLGLAMVDNIVRGSGGRLAITSTPGEETTITLTLPAVKRQAGS